MIEQDTLKIFATKGLPSYAVLKFEMSDNYIGDIVSGLISLINKYGYFKKGVKRK